MINREMPNEETATLTISKITWKLPGENAPSEMLVSTMWYINSLPKESDWSVVAYEYDVACLWMASPLTPLNEIRQWYVMNLSSFMPGNWDLESIKERWTERAKNLEWSSSLNILPKAPEWYCENREPVTSDLIQISILDPGNNEKISTKPDITYSVKSDSLLKSLTITLDGVVVFSKNYVNKIEDRSSTTLDLSAYEAWKHTITVQAVDASSNMNNASINVTIESSDTEPPFFVPWASERLQTEDGKNQITLTFDDHLSGIVWGTVSAGGNVIKSFEWRYTTFSTDVESVDVEVKDRFNNVLKQTINLTEL